MKPSSIRSLLLVSALSIPQAHAQDARAKIREIEQGVLLNQYKSSLQALVGSTGDASDGGFDAIDRRARWLVKIGGEIEGVDKTAADEEEMAMNAGALNDLAWSMITSPDSGARRPDTALKLATIAIELGGGDETLKPKVLDTKARALFLLGKQGEAVAEQEKAVAAATVADEKAALEATLAAYNRNELPEVSEPARVRARFNTMDHAVAPNDLRKMMDDVFALQAMAGKAAKDTSGFAKTDMAQVTRELKERMDELARLTELKGEKKEEASGVSYIMEKLQRIVIPVVDFEDSSVEEAVDFLRKQAAELDAEPDPARKGVNFVIRRPRIAPASEPVPGEGTPPAAPEVGAIRLKELRLRNVPLAVALKYICDSARLRYKVDDFAVTLVPQGETEDVFTRTFRVPSDFGSSLVSIQDLLKMCGIKFGEGASAVLSDDGALLVTNTPTELDKIEQLIPIAIGNSGRGRRESSSGGFPAPPARFGPANVRRSMAFQIKDQENHPAPKGAAGAATLMEKLQRIVIPSITFENTTLEEAVDFLRTQAVALDVNEPDPARKGVNFVISRPAAKSSPAPGNSPSPAPQPEPIRVKELRLRNVPLSEALKYICQSTRMRYKVDDFCVTLMPVDAPQDLFNRTFLVPQGFSSMLAGADEDAVSQDPFSPGSKAPLPVMELLKKNGINFPEGSSASLNDSGQLRVVNTPTELSKIEQLVEAASTPSKPAGR